MKRNNLWITLLSVTIMGACFSPDLTEMTKTMEVPTGAKVLKGSVFASLGNVSPYNVVGISQCGQSLLVGQRNQENQIINICSEDKPGKKFTGRSIDRDAIVGLVNLNNNGQNGYSTFNICTGELKEMVISPLTRSGESEPMVTRLPEQYQHLCAVRAGNYIVSTGLYENGRYLLYLPESQQLKWFLSYPANPDWPVISEKAKSVMYASSVLKVRPDQQAFVCGDMYSGILDFCRITNGQIELIRRHILHSPKVRVNDRTNFPEVLYSRDNRFGFTDLAVTNDRIYALYSGKTNRDHPSDFNDCHQLLVFDWNGDLMENYQLTVPLVRLTYDVNEHCIYGVGTDSEKTNILQVSL